MKALIYELKKLYKRLRGTLFNYKDGPKVYVTSPELKKLLLEKRKVVEKGVETEQKIEPLLQEDKRLKNEIKRIEEKCNKILTRLVLPMITEFEQPKRYELMTDGRIEVEIYDAIADVKQKIREQRAKAK